MGNILKLLSRNIEDTKDDSNVFIDFENCQPTESEKVIYDKIDPKLKRTKEILQILENYRGATVAIKEAISSFNNEELQKKAWMEVNPLMKELKTCYEFAVDLAETVPMVMTVLCSYDQSINEHLESKQATFKQFADILDFILNFDSLKMMSPSIQNDLSYYRRCCSRRRSYGKDSEANKEEAVTDEICGNMSLFYAESTPMLKLITRYISRWRAEDKNVPIETSTECLATIAKICRGIVANPALHQRLTEPPDTVMLCLRVMTAVIIIYDLLDPNGVFKRTSKIDIKPCLKILKEQGLTQTSPLFSAIRFSTVHFNDETTPRNIKAFIIEATA